MISIPLLVVAIIAPVVLVFANLVILAKYVDPEHAAGHYIAKFAVMLGFLVAECSILLLPLDVGNKSGLVGCGFWNNNCGGLDMTLAWEIVYIVIAILVVVVFPFLIFMYEADDEGLTAAKAGKGKIGQMFDVAACGRAFLSAICYEAITLAVAIPVLILTWTYLGVTWIPVSATTVNLQGGGAFYPVTRYVNSSTACGSGKCVFVRDTMKMNTTLIVYLGALIGFVGWFLFTIYVGIGLVALPMDCFNAFKHRPKVMSASEEANSRTMLRRRAEELLAVGDRLATRMIDFKSEKRGLLERRRQGAADRRETNQYRVLVETLESDLEQFEMCRAENFREHYNPLVPYLKLLAGFLATILTVLWILHIILYMLFTPYVSTFLNKYLTFFDKFFPLFGTLSVALFSMYLLIAATKGNFKFGSRFFLISIHPMELHKTLMNSFLFNLALILLCVLPVVQFSTQAFAQYARLTSADVLFSSTMRYLKFFRYFWQYNAFLFAILAIILISAIYFTACPSDKDHLQQVMAKIREKKAAERKNLNRKIDRRGGAIQELPEIKKKGKKK